MSSAHRPSPHRPDGSKPTVGSDANLCTTRKTQQPEEEEEEDKKPAAAGGESEKQKALNALKRSRKKDSFFDSCDSSDDDGDSSGGESDDTADPIAKQEKGNNEISHQEPLSGAAHSKWNAMEHADLRVSPHGWTGRGLPELRHPEPDRVFGEDDHPEPDYGRWNHVAVTGSSEELIVLGGNYFATGEESEGTPVKTVECLNTRTKEWTRLPDMNRVPYGGADGDGFGAVCLERKLYIVGRFGTRIATAATGGDHDEQAEDDDGDSNLLVVHMLDLDDTVAGWVYVSSSPFRNHNEGGGFSPCAAAAIGCDIYVLGTCGNWNSELSYVQVYNTQTGAWKCLEPGRVFGYHLKMVAVAGGGAYRGTSSDSQHLVVMSKDDGTIQAYNVQEGTWITTLPALPETGTGWGDCRLYCHEDCEMVALGNRYVIVLGGTQQDPSAYSTKAVVALDFWNLRRGWFDLPWMNSSRHSCAGAVVGQELVVTGGWANYADRYTGTESLEITVGIGWETEKLLYLCFRGKAQTKEKDPMEPGGCPLNRLESGIFARILSFLFKPFPGEIVHDRSIFRALARDESAAGTSSLNRTEFSLRTEKRDDDLPNQSQAKNYSGAQKPKIPSAFFSEASKDQIKGADPRASAGLGTKGKATCEKMAGDDKRRYEQEARGYSPSKRDLSTAMAELRDGNDDDADALSSEEDPPEAKKPRRTT